MTTTQLDIGLFSNMSNYQDLMGIICSPFFSASEKYSYPLTFILMNVYRFQISLKVASVLTKGLNFSLLSLKFFFKYLFFKNVLL